MPEDHELIVVDDGSSDGTGSILCEYEGRHNVHIFFEEHGGAFAARNAGLKSAESGKCLFIQTAISIISIGSLKRQRSVLMMLHREKDELFFGFVPGNNAKGTAGFHSV